MMTGFGMEFWIIGVLLMIVFWGGLIFLAVWLVKSLFEDKGTTQSPTFDRPPSAGEILDQRYVRGEITREQYQLMKDDLG